MSAVDVPQVGENDVRRRAMRHLERKRLVLLCGGIGQPFVTTDYPAVQRAVELDCDCLLAFKNGIAGVYESDPRKNAGARKFRSISMETAVTEALGFMDRAALVLALQHDVRIHVVGFEQRDAARDAVRGGSVGTVITRDSPDTFYRAAARRRSVGCDGGAGAPGPLGPVAARPGQETLRASGLDHPSSVGHDDPVGAGRQGEVVQHHDPRLTRAPGAAQPGPQLPRGGAVEPGGRFLEHEERGAAQKRASDGDALPFAARRGVRSAAAGWAC